MDELGDDLDFEAADPLPGAEGPAEFSNGLNDAGIATDYAGEIFEFADIACSFCMTQHSSTHAAPGTLVCVCPKERELYFSLTTAPDCV